jgi:hypothetical protein
VDRTLDRSSDALDCFTHGLAHLIAVYGHERGAALAGQMALELLEGPGFGLARMDHDIELRTVSTGMTAIRIP